MQGQFVSRALELSGMRFECYIYVWCPDATNGPRFFWSAQQVGAVLMKSADPRWACRGFESWVSELQRFGLEAFHVRRSAKSVSALARNAKKNIVAEDLVTSLVD